IAAALSRMTPADWIERNAVPGAGVDLRQAQITRESDWPRLEAAKFWTATPLVIRTRDQGTLKTLPEDLSSRLNATMARRFGRPFHLIVRPDSLYVRQHPNLNIVVPIKCGPQGQRILRSGIRLPLTIIGPSDELATIWTSGLGANTAYGFGWLTFYREPVRREGVG
ncbi:hypothetical protein, partial [Methylacidiphilum caldifontis]